MSADTPNDTHAVPSDLIREASRPGRTLGHYRLEQRLGAGGMGEVFRARDVALGRAAAVKVLPSSLSEELRLRLRREADAGTRLQHPAIATFFESGEEGDDTYIAMECVDGCTLRERLRAGAMEVEEALAVASCLLSALGHAHAAGILHRDIKPENIMVTGPRTAKLLDFGLALPLAAQNNPEPAVCSPDTPTGSVLTLAGGVVGTIGYMAPEQIRGEPLDERTDLFQAGAVLYEMFAGAPAFPGRAATERLAATLTRDPEFARLEAPSMPRGLAVVARRALAREPSRRHPSAAALLRDVLDLSEGRSHAELAQVLAVVDFENLSASPEVDWLGAGIAESLTTDLGRMAGLTVVPRPRVLTARAVPCSGDAALAAGLALGCGFVLTGSFQCMGSAIRITTRLLQVPTGDVLATGKLDGRLDDLFALQDRLAATVATNLNLDARTEAAPRVHPQAEAYECYTRAQALARAGRDSLAIAHGLLQRAMDLSPAWAPPVALDAWVVGLLTIVSSSSSEIEQSLALADRAIALDPGHGPGWVARGYARLRQGRFEEALHAYQAAIAIDPGDNMGHYFVGAIRSFMGDTLEAVDPFRQSLERDPRFGMGWLGLGGAFLQLGQLDEASHSFSRALALEGERSTFPTAGASSYLAEVARQQERPGEARELALAGIATSENSDHPYRDFFRGYGLGVLGRAALDADDAEAARAAFGQLLVMLKGRPRVRSAGHLVVQALAGLARANRSAPTLDEALALFADRSVYNFEPFYGCMDDKDLFELALAARALERPAQAAALLARARAAGSREACPDQA